MKIKAEFYPKTQILSIGKKFPRHWAKVKWNPCIVDEIWHKMYCLDTEIIMT